MRLQGANRHLRERLQDALQELEAAHAQLRILNGLQQRLEHATPGAAELAAAALEQERALQAARDAQVLQLLRAKVRCRGCCRWLPPSAEMSCKPPCCHALPPQDDVIESFEARHAESRAEAAQYKEQLGAAQQQLDVSQLRVRELLEDKGRLRQQAEQAAAAGADAEHALQAQLAELRADAAQCGPLRQQVQLLEQQLEDARGDLGGAHRQLQTLSDTVDAANDAIVVSGNGGSCTSSASSSMVVYVCLLWLPGLHLTCLPV